MPGKDAILDLYEIHCRLRYIFPAIFLFLMCIYVYKGSRSNPDPDPEERNRGAGYPQEGRASALD